MSPAARQVAFTEAFLDSVHLVDKYFQQRNPGRGQQFVRELFDLLYDIVAVFPQSQPMFGPLGRRLPGREFRKAIFRRQYLAIYEVKAEELVFVLFRHSSLDPEHGLEQLVAELV